MEFYYNLHSGEQIKCLEHICFTELRDYTRGAAWRDLPDVDDIQSLEVVNLSPEFLATNDGAKAYFNDFLMSYPGWKDFVDYNHDTNVWTVQIAGIATNQLLSLLFAMRHLWKDYQGIGCYEHLVRVGAHPYLAAMMCGLWRASSNKWQMTGHTLYGKRFIDKDRLRNWMLGYGNPGPLFTEKREKDLGCTDTYIAYHEREDERLSHLWEVLALSTFKLDIPGLIELTNSFIEEGG